MHVRLGLPPADAESSKRTAVVALARFAADRYVATLEPVFAPDYRAGVEALVAGTLDAAWLAPLGLLRAERQVRPVAVLVRAERGSYHGALVARRDANLVGLRDLAGKRIGWVDPDSAAGYVLTRALIAEQRQNVDAFLGPQTILGSHRAVVVAVLEREVDAGATFLNFGPDGAIAHSGWQEFLGDRAKELAPLAITGSIPGDVIAVRQSMTKDEGAALVGLLGAIAADPDGRALFAEVFNGAVALAAPQPGEHDALAAQAQRAGWRP